MWRQNWGQGTKLGTGDKTCGQVTKLLTGDKTCGQWTKLVDRGQNWGQGTKVGDRGQNLGTNQEKAQSGEQGQNGDNSFRRFSDNSKRHIGDILPSDPREWMTFIGATILSDGRYIFSVAGQTVGSIWMTDGTDEGTGKLLTMDLTVDTSGETFYLPYFGYPRVIDGSKGTVFLSGLSAETGYELYKFTITPLRTIRLTMMVHHRELFEVLARILHLCIC
jgi:hypothetical protein